MQEFGGGQRRSSRPMSTLVDSVGERFQGAGTDASDSGSSLVASEAGIRAPMSA
jgi:hypothetical protein